MKEKIIVVCALFFMFCMLTVPSTASLQVDDNTDKKIATSINSGEMNSYRAITMDKRNLTEDLKKLSPALLMQTSACPLATPQIPSSFESSLQIKNIPMSSGSSGSLSAPRNLISGKLAYVYVYMKPGFSTHIIDSIVYDVPNRDENSNLAVAWVDIQNLKNLASLNGVRTVSEVTPPVVNTGSVITAGDSIHKTVNIRSTYGYRGAGMKIGIISDGVDNIASAVTSGDLPANVTVLSNAQGGDEGTAMLEIVHDMVPDAELYFHDMGDNNLAFNAAIDALVAQGCTVICDDISYYSEPYFEDGIIASHINALLSGNKILYLSAAGNAGSLENFASRHHYQGNYYNYLSGSSNWHDFSRGTSTTKGLYLNMPTGSSVTIYLQWDDLWGYSDNDYDLYLHNMSGSILSFKAGSQSGTGNPIETLSYTNTGSSKDVVINVLNFSALETKNLEIFIFTDGNSSVYTNNIVQENSITGHNSVVNVITVAAVPASSPATIEAYSSRGPVTITYPSPETRQKPDISGVDCVSVTGVGGFGSTFCGTSASAPHIAAIVAQYWGAHPTMTPGQVRTALYTHAVDLGSSGKDTIFGYGLADALKMADGGSSDSRPVPGDWDGDGKDGIAIFRNTTGYWYFDYELDGIANKYFRYGGSTDRIITGDWDGDGKDGIAIFRPSTGYWYFDYELDGIANKYFRYGGSTDRIITGDWDGDGKDGIAIFRPSTGYWYFDYELDGIVNKSFRYGGSADQIIKGDWDGDGKDGIAIFRPSTGYWYFDYELDGIVNKSFRYGGSTDQIIKGDWDGDGKDGIAIFRPSTGYWYFDYELDGIVNKSIYLN